MSIARRSLLAIAVLALATGSTWAREWPAKTPIRIVVPYPAGGNADSSARAVADVVSANLKQSVIVDNRPGASSVIGTQVVARAPADGYTLGVVSDSHAINRPLASCPRRANCSAPRQPAMKDKLALSGDPYPATPAELTARLRRDIDAYGVLIQATVK